MTVARAVVWLRGSLRFEGVANLLEGFLHTRVMHRFESMPDGRFSIVRGRRICFELSVIRDRITVSVIIIEAAIIGVRIGQLLLHQALSRRSLSDASVILVF